MREVGGASRSRLNSIGVRPVDLFDRRTTYNHHLETNYGFRSRELYEIQALVIGHADQLVEAWNEYFNQD